MKECELTLLTKETASALPSGRISAQATDLAVLTGAQINLRYPIGTLWCDYWTMSRGSVSNSVIFVNDEGHFQSTTIDSDALTIRPVIALKGSMLDEMRRMFPNGGDIELGEYPQMAAPLDIQALLEKKYQDEDLIETGKTYTFNLMDNKFAPDVYEEYEYNGKKYIGCIYRFYGNPRLSNGGRYEAFDRVWIEVQPIRWIFDGNQDILVSEKCLLAGMAFSYDTHFKYLGFESFKYTEMKNFLDKYMIGDMDINYEKREIQTAPIQYEPSNPYELLFNEVTEEDIIKASVVSNVPVFLHGKSSDGKSARVKQLDPDCVILYLRNATPDSLNGKSVYNQSTGEMIDIKPTWLVKLEERCQAEPDKIHILFLDELTNALPSIQGMAFNIVLDREVNGIWKLPDNARIVAAGNDLEDSLAANELAEPLFNRFAHVYIKTNLDNWLTWATTPDANFEPLKYMESSEPMKIHPAIYAYIAYKGDSVLRTPYVGIEPNADPRKWEMASKMLYETKTPLMLRSLVGESIARDFTAFCQKSLVTVEDVINGNYTDDYFNSDLSIKYATVAGLSQVDKENFKIVREFVSKLGSELRATFDSLWSKGDIDRLEYIASLEDEYVKVKTK